MGSRIVIIGSGGHGKVVFDAIKAQQKYDIVGFVDHAVIVDTIVIDNYKVIAQQNDIDLILKNADFFIVAIGNNIMREQVYNLFKSLLKPATIIHPSSIIGSNVRIEEGVVILANSVLNANSNIRENSIVNAGVIVDHDCEICNSVHLSIGTIVGSNSLINKGYMTTIGQNLNSFSNII